MRLERLLPGTELSGPTRFLVAEAQGLRVELLPERHLFQLARV